MMFSLPAELAFGLSLRDPKLLKLMLILTISLPIIVMIITTGHSFLAAVVT